MSESEQESPYVEDLTTADGAVRAAQRLLRASLSDTNLCLELSRLGWDVVPKARFEFPCNVCGKPLKVPGALYFGPPYGNGEVRKRHICVECSPVVEALLRR